MTHNVTIEAETTWMAGETTRSIVREAGPIGYALGPDPMRGDHEVTIGWHWTCSCGESGFLAPGEATWDNIVAHAPEAERPEDPRRRRAPGT